MGDVIPLSQRKGHVPSPVPPADVYVYTVEQVGALLGISRGLAYQMVRAGEIPAKRTGNRWIISAHMFHAWLNTPDDIAKDNI